MASSFKKRLLGVVGPRISLAVRVAAVQALGEHFRIIDLEAEAFRTQTWGPTDKVQIDTGEWEIRTYTPMRLPDAADKMRLLAFVHGNGPGSQWAATVKPGDGSHIVGPRGSMNVGDGPLTLVGDESSFATALNLKDRTDVKFVFEVSSVVDSRKVLADLGIRNASVVAKAEDGAHLAQMHDEVYRHMNNSESMRAVLTGSAQTIQSTMRSLKGRGIKTSRLSSKPYWAKNKVGLD